MAFISFFLPTEHFLLCCQLLLLIEPFHSVLDLSLWRMWQISTVLSSNISAACFTSLSLFSRLQSLPFLFHSLCLSSATRLSFSNPSVLFLASFILYPSISNQVFFSLPFLRRFNMLKNRWSISWWCLVIRFFPHQQSNCCRSTKYSFGSQSFLLTEAIQQFFQQAWENM